MKRIARLIPALFFPVVVSAAPFCAVTATGANCSYYDVQTCRQGAGPGGTCAVNPNEMQPSSQPQQRGPDYIRRNPFVEEYERGMRGRADEQERQLRQIEIEQRQRDIARQNTDPRLLPLVPDGSMSAETRSAIMTALFTSLDMNAPGTSRDWSNPQTGAEGNVRPYDVVTNMFGEPCREFTIALNFKGQNRFTSGTACRKNGQWVWLGG